MQNEMDSKNQFVFFTIDFLHYWSENKNEGGNFQPIRLIPHRKIVLGLSSSFRNSLFYNRGKQKHSVTLLYLENKTKNFL
jgi:hypothetical protein